jgi:anti-sigma factor RsiW
MRCAECRESLNALIDGETATDHATEIREHLAGCAECRREHGVLVETSSTLRNGLVRHPAPDVLKARLRNALAQPHPFEEPPRQRSWMALAAAGLVIAVASSGITLAVARRAPRNAPAAEVLSSHVRSLMPGHLTDVTSTDQHNVKPWFNGRVDFAPSVPGLDSLGFPLVGGRIDYVGDRPVAALVYGRRQHMISVYSWPAETGRGDHGPAASEARGYNLSTWTSGGLAYWAVSDLNRRELDEFVRAFNAR